MEPPHVTICILVYVLKQKPIVTCAPAAEIIRSCTKHAACCWSNEVLHKLGFILITTIIITLMIIMLIIISIMTIIIIIISIMMIIIMTIIINLFITKLLQSDRFNIWTAPLGALGRGTGFSEVILKNRILRISVSRLNYLFLLLMFLLWARFV